MSLVVVKPRLGETRWHSYGPPRATLPEDAPKPPHVLRDILLPLGITRQQLDEEPLYLTVCNVLRNEAKFPLTDAQSAALVQLKGRLDALASAAHTIRYDLVLPKALQQDGPVYRDPETLVTEAYQGYVDAGVAHAAADGLTVYQQMVRMWSVTDIAAHVQPIVRGHPDAGVARLTRKNFWATRERTLEEAMLAHYGPDALGTAKERWALGHLGGRSVDPASGTKRPATHEWFADVRGPYSDPLHNYGIHKAPPLSHYVCCGQPLGSPGCLVGAQIPGAIPQPSPYPWFGGLFDDDDSIGQLVTLSSGGRGIFAIRRRLERGATQRGTTFVPSIDVQDAAHERMLALVTTEGLSSALARSFVAMRSGQHATLLDALAAAEVDAAQPKGTYMRLLREYAQQYARYNGPIFHMTQHEAVRDVTEAGAMMERFHTDKWAVVPPAPVRPLPAVVPPPRVTPPEKAAEQPRPYVLLLELDPDDLLLENNQKAWLTKASATLDTTAAEETVDRDIITEMMTHYAPALFDRIRERKRYEQSNNLQESIDLVATLLLTPDDPDDQLSLLARREAVMVKALKDEADDIRQTIEAYNRDIVRPFNAIHRVQPKRRPNEMQQALAGVLENMRQTGPRASIMTPEVIRALNDDDIDLELLTEYAHDIKELRDRDIPDAVQRIERIISRCELEMVTGTVMTESITQAYLDQKWNTADCREALTTLLRESYPYVRNAQEMAQLIRIGYESGILYRSNEQRNIVYQVFGAVTSYVNQPTFRTWQLTRTLEDAQPGVFYLPQDGQDASRASREMSMAMVTFLTAYFGAWKGLLTQEYRQRNQRDEPAFRRTVAKRLESAFDLAQKLLQVRKQAFAQPDPEDNIDDAGHGLVYLSMDAQDKLERARLELELIRDLIVARRESKRATRKGINRIGAEVTRWLDDVEWSEAQQGVLADFAASVRRPIPRRADRDQRAIYIGYVLELITLFEMIGVEIPRAMDRSGAQNVTKEQIQDRIKPLLVSLDWYKANWVVTLDQLAQQEPQEPVPTPAPAPATPQVVEPEGPLFLTRDQRKDFVEYVLTYFNDLANIDPTTDFSNTAVVLRELASKSVGRFAVLRNLILSGKMTRNHIEVRDTRGLDPRQQAQMADFLVQSGFLKETFEPPQGSPERMIPGTQLSIKDVSKDRLMYTWGGLEIAEHFNNDPHPPVYLVKRKRNEAPYNRVRRIGLPSQVLQGGIEYVRVTWVRHAAREMALMCQALLNVTDATKQDDLQASLDELLNQLRRSQRRYNRIRDRIAEHVEPPSKTGWWVSAKAWTRAFGGESELPDLPPEPSAPPADQEDDDEETEEAIVVPSAPPLNVDRWVLKDDGTRTFFSDCAAQFRNKMSQTGFKGAPFLRTINNACIGQLMAKMGGIIGRNVNAEQLELLTLIGTMVGAVSPDRGNRGEWIVDGWIGVESNDAQFPDRPALFIRRQPRVARGRIMYDANAMQNLFKAWALFSELVVFVTSQKAADWTGQLTDEPSIAAHIDRIYDASLNIGADNVYQGSDAQGTGPTWQPIGNQTNRHGTFSLPELQMGLQDISRDDAAWINARQLDLDVTVNQKYVHPILHALRQTVSRTDRQALVERYLSATALHDIGALRNIRGRYRVVSGLTTQGPAEAGTAYFVGTTSVDGKSATPYPRDAQLRLMQRWGTLAALLDEIQSDSPNTQHLDQLEAQLGREWKYPESA